MNILNITKSLHERINVATTTEEVIVLTKAIERLNLGTVKVVTTYTDLLQEYPQEGEVFFVENEERLYYGFNGFWFLIFTQAATLAYSWGRNTNGPLGDGTTSNRSSPVSVVGGFTDWIQVSVGQGHSLGLRANGTLWSWGLNATGQVGDNTASQRSSPVSVVGGFTDWKSTSAGINHSLAIRGDGILYAWGLNIAGPLGDNTTSSRSSPVSVVGGFTDWVQVSAGANHSLGLRANGTLWSWGTNAQGQLGHGTTSSRSSPVSVIGGFTDWTEISSGYISNIALRTNGALYAWGFNAYGRLGDGTTSNRSSPVSVVGGFTDWTQISAGRSHCLGLRANGTIWAWGRNQYGQLGDGTTSNRSSPVSVVGGFTDWASAMAGRYNSIGLRANGTLWAWGHNNYGQLGTNNVTNRSSPVSVVGGFTDWISAAKGEFHSIAIRAS